ncbi:hypothetical protein T08_9042 [Trichinella sp. T8]|nr:hypothetical protein T08_9042 [Trichinella sp. T8]
MVTEEARTLLMRMEEASATSYLRGSNKYCF